MECDTSACEQAPLQWILQDRLWTTCQQVTPDRMPPGRSAHLLWRTQESAHLRLITGGMGTGRWELPQWTTTEDAQESGVGNPRRVDTTTTPWSPVPPLQSDRNHFPLKENGPNASSGPMQLVVSYAAGTGVAASATATWPSRPEPTPALPARTPPERG